MVATFRRKIPLAVSANQQAVIGHQKLDLLGEYLRDGIGIDCARPGGWLSGDKAADVDDIVGDDPKIDPAFRAIVTTVEATLVLTDTCGRRYRPGRCSA
jgi:hypothetical protein